MTHPGIDATAADDIIAEREQGGREGLTGSPQMEEDYFFKDVNNLFARVPELARIIPEEQQRLRQLVGMGSSVLRIRSTGRSHGVEYKITAMLGTKISGTTMPGIRR